MHDDQEARLQSLEVTNRWLKGGLVACACLAFVALFRAAPQPPDPAVVSDVVRTRQLEVVNKAGTIVMMSRAIGERGGFVSLYGKGGTVAIVALEDALNVSANRIKSKQNDSTFSLSCGKTSTSLTLRHGDDRAKFVAQHGINRDELPGD
jgi:hypothetical protein